MYNEFAEVKKVRDEYAQVIRDVWDLLPRSITTSSSDLVASVQKALDQKNEDLERSYSQARIDVDELSKYLESLEHWTNTEKSMKLLARIQGWVDAHDRR